jgi:hypothetical protein
MQAVISEVDGFKGWYAARIESLRKDRLSEFFNAYRVASVHIGDTVVRGGSCFTQDNGKRRVQYFFMSIPEVPMVPDEDVTSVCTAHFTTLLRVVYDAFETFPYNLDDRWYYTEDHFLKMGKSIDDAIEELGFPRDWAKAASGFPEAEKWRILRRSRTVGCQLNNVFHSYLGMTVRGPDDLIQ